MWISIAPGYSLAHNIDTVSHCVTVVCHTQSKWSDALPTSPRHLSHLSVTERSATTGVAQHATPHHYGHEHND